MRGLVPAFEETAEQIAEAAVVLAASGSGPRTIGFRAEGVGKIEASKAEAAARAGATRARAGGRTLFGVEAVLVIHGALVVVAEDIVGFLKPFELILGSFVAGIEIGMKLAGEAAVGFADIVAGGLAFHAESLI